MVGGHDKQSDSNTTATSSSASAFAVSADWGIAPPLLNVRVDTQYVEVIEEQNNKLNHFRKNLLSSIVSDIEHCQQMQAGERMFKVIEEGEYDCNIPHKSASNCFLCTRSHLARKQDASKKLE
jgi:hypothetical protein